MEINQVEQLLNEVQTISESYDRVADATGERFNIFSILQMETDEVATHSRFLAELLNPKGRHGQQDAFLKQFVETFEITNFNTQKAVVVVEKHVGQVSQNNDSGGRIDIWIQSDNEVIMIENKINAGEQPKQLLRYHNAFPNGTLLYLTLFGEGSKEEISKTIEYKSISYKDDIINWLEECRKIAVNIPILRESISQYICLIKKLTYQNLNTKMSQDIVNRILKDESSFNAFRLLVTSKDKVLKYVIDESLIPLLKRIEKEKNLKLFTWGLNERKDYMGFSFSNDDLLRLNLSIFFRFEKGKDCKDFIYGFKSKDEKEATNFNYENLRKKFGKYKGFCWIEYSGYDDWRDLKVCQKVLFGEFEEDIKAKIDSMLEMIKDI